MCSSDLHKVLLRLSHWSPQGFALAHAVWLKRLYYIDSETDFGIIIEPCLSVLGTVDRLFHHLRASFADLNLLMCTLTFKRMVAEFVNQLGDHGAVRMQATAVMTQYETLKSITDTQNRAIGPILFGYVFEELSFYSYSIKDLTRMDNWLQQFRYVYFLANFMFILFTAAYAQQQLSEEFGNWLADTRNRDAVPQSQLTVVTAELTNHRVGLSGLGLFTITYGFVGTAISTILAYAIIILQVHE